MKRETLLRGSERGASLTELIILTPVLVVSILGAVDLGRLIYAHQVLTDLTRETANLVSRGTNEQTALTAAVTANESLDLANSGLIIISRIRRRSETSANPWVFEQVSYGGVDGAGSKIGSLNGPAKIPNVNDLDPGVQVTAVEIMHQFEPVFGLSAFGLDFFPEVMYDAAFF